MLTFPKVSFQSERARRRQQEQQQQQQQQRKCPPRALLPAARKTSVSFWVLIEIFESPLARQQSFLVWLAVRHLCTPTQICRPMIECNASHACHISSLTTKARTRVRTLSLRVRRMAGRRFVSHTKPQRAVMRQASRHQVTRFAEAPQCNAAHLLPANAHSESAMHVLPASGACQQVVSHSGDPVACRGRDTKALR